MSQTTFLRSLDAAMMAEFLAAEMADSAVYNAGTAIPCTVYVDRDVAVFGEDDPAAVAGVQTHISLRLAEVASPVRGATVTIGAEVFKLAELVQQDESLSRWVVVRG